MRRIRTVFAAWSCLFNQVVHLGNAPYPYSFSETCWLRRHRLQYQVARAIIDNVFSLFGEENHCELSYYVGQSFRAKDQL